ncbi:MAG TPA: hypothetical protein VHZ51_12410 [Ktedonobacteraceae bacterium]|nr:hypothetical protein [Ktedonobacteraceae bacterium]
MTSTARGKPRALAPYLRPMICPRPFVGWTASARLAERGPQAGGSRQDTNNGVTGA